MKVSQTKKSALIKRIITIQSKLIDLGFALSEAGVSDNSCVQSAARSVRAIEDKINQS